MSTQSNTYSQGGGGTIFEINVQTAFFITFLLGGQLPGLPGSHITYFRQQSGSLGYETDDVLMRCEDEIAQRQLLVQIKHQITASAENATFREVVTAAWKDFNNADLFKPCTDRIYLITSGFAMTVRNHLLPLLSWAKAKDSPSDYLHEVNRIGLKKGYFEMFKTIIASTTPGVTDEDVFRFFKCFEMVDYDLDQQTSMTKNALINLLSLAKYAEHSATGIWTEVFELLADTNAKGGEYPLSSRPETIMAKLKNTYLSEMQKTLLRLSARSQDLLEGFSDKIGTCHLDRGDVLAEATGKVAAGQILIVTGEAGAGKSALAKALIAQLQERGTGYVLAFKADELLRGQLRDWFDRQNVNQDIRDVFSHFSLLPNAAVYVDSMERLLEDEALPFRQLLSALRDLPSIKFIGSCRRSLLTVINLKFFSSAAPAEQIIPYLSDSELEEVCRQVPQLKPAVDNTELQELIRIPKYLDFALKAIHLGGGDYGKMSEVQFQQTLWSAIVENVLDNAHHGLPMRRSESFIDIAVVRSRKMEYFVSPSRPDPEALEALQKETVLLQFQHLPLYAPAHDVLEDWALTRFADSIFGTGVAGGEFFSKLGTEPAMRRAYRLWVVQALKEQDKKKIAFFTQNLTDASLDRFWHIESLIAVLSSPHCERFLQSNLALLKTNEWALLFRIIQIMRTASRVTGTYLGQKALLPVGSGWAAVFKILADDRSGIPVKYHPVLLAMLEEWKLGVLVSPDLPTGTREAGQLAQFLLNGFLSGNGQLGRKDHELKQLIQLLFAFAGGIPKELKGEFDRAPALVKLDAKEDQNQRLIRYGEALLELSLQGPATSQLARYLPEIVIEQARNQWYRMPRAKLKDMEELIAQAHEDSDMDHSFRFGLASGRHIEGTESAFSTPVYWLLQYHTDLALDFVIELLNLASSQYATFNNENDPVFNITFTLPDGSTTHQTGSFWLWTMFRGQAGYGNPLLVSVLMALEKYLLESGEADDEPGLRFQYLVEVLLTKSHTVALTGVVASAVMAYPQLAGQWVLPLLDQQAFYSWDSGRYQEDLGELFLFQDGSLDVKERNASHRLPHRKKHFAGLRGFVIFYWITVGTLNQQIAAMIDRLLATADPADLDWKKILEEIDGRRLVLGKKVEHEGKQGFEVQTEYSEDVRGMVDAFQAQHAPEHEQMAQVHRLKQAFDNKQQLPFDEWTQIYEQYTKLETFNSLRHAPGLLAAVGIRDFWVQFSLVQQDWCVNKIEEITMSFGLSGLTGHQLGILNLNLYDTAAVVQLLPRMPTLPEIAGDVERKTRFEQMIFFAQVAYAADNNTDYKRLVKALHQDFWRADPALALNMWYGALALGRRGSGLPSPRSFETDKAYVEAVTTFLADIYPKVRAGDFAVDFEHVDLSEYFPWALVRAIKLIPDLDPPAGVQTFLRVVVVAYLQRNLSATRYRSGDLHEVKYPLETKLGGIFLYSALGDGAKLMRFFCTLLAVKEVIQSIQRNNSDLFYFFQDTVKQVIREADQAVAREQVDKQQIGELFQAAWKTLHRISQEINGVVYGPTLLLNIRWDEGARDWLPIAGMRSFFLDYLKTGVALFPDSAINLLASVGDKTLLPEALELLVEQLQQLKAASTLVLYKQTKAEQLVRNLNDFHLEAIREDPVLMSAYQWLLDTLIDEGSTDAYWLNEFVISYHRKIKE